MNRHRRVLFTVLAILAGAGVAGSLYQSPAQDKLASPERSQGKPDSPEVAAVRQTAEAFVKAFNQGDAKAVAAFWTKEGEFVGLDGAPIRGRETIEKEYAEFFKKNSKANLEIQIELVRPLGRHTVLEEGRLKLQLPGDKEPVLSRYSVLHVHEDDGWRMASVREWELDPAELVSLKDIEWLVGEWATKSEDSEARLAYVWDDDKAFLRGRYSLTQGGKLVSSGMQVIAKEPTGGLRSWQFDSNGSFGEWTWVRDGAGWVIDGVGTLPDGSQLTAVNLLLPLGPDAFTWQSVERTAAGSPLPDTPPVRVARVKTAK